MLDENAVVDEQKSWYNFIIQCEHLFLRNIYSEVDLKRMGVSNIDDYLLTIEKLRPLYSDFENALNGRDLSEELSNFIREDLKDC